MEAIILRRIDELGRVVLPLSARNQLGLTEKDELEIAVRKYLDEFGNPAQEIVLRRCAGECALCGKKGRQLQKMYHVCLCRECFFQLLETQEPENTKKKEMP